MSSISWFLGGKFCGAFGHEFLLFVNCVPVLVCACFDASFFLAAAKVEKLILFLLEILTCQYIYCKVSSDICYINFNFYIVQNFEEMF